MKSAGRHNKAGSIKSMRKSSEELDAAIIGELLADGYVSSSTISQRHKAPLSTVQRRRKNLENTTLIRRYEIDLRRYGFRIGEITIIPKKGISKEIAEHVLSTYSKNIISVFLKIDSTVVLTLIIYFKTTQEIHEIMESINTISSVANVRFAETVEILREKSRKGIVEALIQHSSDPQK
jgi:DNA-binding Lrp family transcriptional regulator